MNQSALQKLPETLHSQIECLLSISPLFESLINACDEPEYQQLFCTAEHALLPELGEHWFPECASTDINECLVHLRQLKQRAMRHIIWWELGLHEDIERSYQSITLVAEALLEQALVMAERLIAPRFGRLEHGSFCIIGLGKLGGRELNLGSDVDPLFLWQGSGSSAGGRKAVAANEYYAHLSRMLIRLMSEYAVGGIVWPVDMRLRPGGDGAAICLNLDATLSHYLEYGQTWERAMLIKARPVVGDRALGEAFVAGVAPFVYRRYLDYSSVAALAEMKRRIDRQAGQTEISEGFDVKRGRGGIREVEFIIQSMQLLHGGSQSCLRLVEGKTALIALQQQGLITLSETEKLFDSYCFWRRVEHAVQARKGEQTHALPTDYVDYLTKALAIDNIEECMHQHAAYVRSIFSERVLPISELNESEQGWLDDMGLLDAYQLSDESREAIKKSLQQMHEQLLRGMLPERSRKQVGIILDEAMPCWLDDANAVQAIAAFEKLLHSIAGRATWIDLLATHRGALQWLIGALSASRYLSEHIAKNPSWLEWPLLSVRGAVEIDRLCHEITTLDGQDEGAFLAGLGQLVDQARIRCALAVDAHSVDPLVMGGWLADVADAAVQACLKSSLLQLKLPLDFPMVALALGKHGSREMGLVSDLDMVFVMAGDPGEVLQGRTLREWAQRVGRRMIRQLTGLTPFGAGYEFDSRLRPSGNSGVLVTTLQGFRDYQLDEAQTWEHQALCRARAVTSGQNVQDKVMAVIHEVLNLSRDKQGLARDVITMREKMLSHLGSKGRGSINLKQDAGGLVDIEFLAQYARLAFGPADGQNNVFGTVDYFENMPKSAPLAWHESAVMLAQTYQEYRQMENALRVELWQSIGSFSVDIHAAEWETMRRHASIHTPDTLYQRMQAVHACFRSLLS
ncbi:MAG: bifunctional [glutamate--ammonia ligase]-adenylyl-L-tyrosine phosphorylase/[glutamate--ammonia-ligase] adenylyltransferase [Mariprofundaceae bacterium]